MQKGERGKEQREKIRIKVRGEGLPTDGLWRACPPTVYGEEKGKQLLKRSIQL